MKYFSDEIRYKILKRLEVDPDLSQRQLAKSLGISLGKLNYCLQGLVEKGWVKVGNFRRSQDKKAYAYLLTPKGVDEKARVTVRYLKYKQEEYDVLQKELVGLREEAALIAKSKEVDS